MCRGEHVPFGAAADRSGQMQARSGLAATGQDEAAQRLELGVQLVAESLERLDTLRADAQPLARAFGRRNAEIGAQIEKLVLNSLQQQTQPLGWSRGERQADCGPQLVE